MFSFISFQYPTGKDNQNFHLLEKEFSHVSNSQMAGAQVGYAQSFPRNEIYL